MKKLSVHVIIIVLILFSSPRVFGAYKVPPPDILRLIDAPMPSYSYLSPDESTLLFMERRLYPPISLVSHPTIPLAGLRINSDSHSLQRLTDNPSLSLLHLVNGDTIKLKLPDKANVDPPSWSPDSKRFAFTLEGEKGLQLCVGSAEKGNLTFYRDMKLNNITGDPFTWLHDGTHLLVMVVPPAREPAPQVSTVPLGPKTEETSGKIAPVRTYQNLLRNPRDEKLFSWYAASQPALLDVTTGKVTFIGSPGIYLEVSSSPDGQYFLAVKLTEPFSYSVPFELFPKRIEIWNRQGNVVKVLATLPVQDEIPTEGVPTGPRDFHWVPSYPARLLWVEALDGGDPTRKVPFREKLMIFDAPFTGEPGTTGNLQHRLEKVRFMAEKDRAIITEFDRSRQWLMFSLVDLSHPGETRKVLFERNRNDQYNNPGIPVSKTNENGEALVVQEGDFIYLDTPGASPQGDRPGLVRYNLKDGSKEMLFQSAEKRYEYFSSFYHGKKESILIKSESPSDPPNMYLVNLKSGEKNAITSYKDPTPELRAISKELVKYRRASDGVDLSGTLYLPPGYKKGTRLPLVMWAYPQEFNDSSVAGQVRGSPYRFTFYTGISPLLFLTRGYAVLYNAAMPVVGDPETKNNTFIEQIVSSASSAIDYLDKEGIIDRRRVIVGGHSYGAFMTANLLAHSRLFAAGIARSGAYNRTLTPFGFQNERRSFWEAPDIYIKISPFTSADKIKDPLLLIHGEADDNSGTFPIQSERLFDAIKGNGGTARLVILPCESHSYAARESVLHVIAEMFEWGDRYVKNR